MRRKRVVFGWLVVSTALLAAGSCTGSDEDALPRYAETCDGRCVEGLECVNRLCTLRCGNDSDCKVISANGVCDPNYCYESCTTSQHCPNQLACTQQQTSPRMTCRPR